MGRRNRWSPPLHGAKPPTEPPEIIELKSDDDKAGVPLPPYVELTPRSPPLEIIELYPSPLPPPPPTLTREIALSRVQVGFSALNEDELQFAHLWLIGLSREDVGDELGLSEKKVRNLWQHMRWKLRLALEGKEPVGSPPGYEKME
jgi:DNA-binding CsgD family transcriptional regulator